MLEWENTKSCQTTQDKWDALQDQRVGVLYWFLISSWIQFGLLSVCDCTASWWEDKYPSIVVLHTQLSFTVFSQLSSSWGPTLQKSPQTRVWRSTSSELTWLLFGESSKLRRREIKHVTLLSECQTVAPWKKVKTLFGQKFTNAMQCRNGKMQKSLPFLADSLPIKVKHV